MGLAAGRTDGSTSPAIFVFELKGPEQVSEMA